MKNTISIKGKELIVNGSLPIVFEEEIEEIVDMEDVVIVLTMPEQGHITANRIYGVKDEKIVWRVQDILEYDPGYAIFGPDVYAGIGVCEKNPSLIVGTTGYGFRMLIDPTNGKIVGKDGWTK